MEHIVQFAINVDDERIKAICEESAAKQIIDDIKEFSHGRGWNNEFSKEPKQLQAMFTEAIDKFIKDNAEVIIDKAVAEVSKNMMKSKKVQTALDNTLQKGEV